MATCECMDTVKIREGPSTEFSDIGRVYPGDIVQFQSFTENEGRVWGEIDYDKYCCFVDTNGSKYFKIREDGGNVSGNVSGNDFWNNSRKIPLNITKTNK